VTRLYLSPPDVGPRERELLLAAFDSNWVAPAGPDLAAFEVALAQKTGRKFSVALSSGTAAIHLGLLLSGVTAGDEVFVSTFTFSGSVNPIMYLGAIPVFIDSDEDSWNMDASLVEQELTRRRAAGEKMPKAVLAVDLYGQVANMVALRAACEPFGVPIFEDAAEALGATGHGCAGGSFGHWAAMSFNGNKIITTGGGGALVTDDEVFANRVRSLSTQARLPVVHYEHQEVGFNYRMSNLLAAVGRGQLEALDHKVARRNQINERYKAGLGDINGVSWQPIPEWSKPNQWLSCIVLDPAVFGDGVCERVRLALEADDIESRPLWKPMHMQPIFAKFPSVLNGVGERLFRTGLCVPSGSGMPDTDVDRVVAIIRQTLTPAGT
jgi:pyridoxal phosphate-dependent aminotransferase EpsN